MTVTAFPSPREPGLGWPWEPYEERDTSERWPRISVVVPSLNQGAFLEETLRSVLMQHYPNLELIVMDGGSTDDSLAVIAHYADALTYWRSERDGGQAQAINDGWRRATGEILTFLNSDDVYLPYALRTIAHASLTQPAAGILYGSMWVARADGRPFRVYGDWEFDLRELLSRGRSLLAQPAVFLRRSVVDATGWLDESMHYCFDYDYWIRASSAATFYKISRPLASARFHDDAKSVRYADAFPAEALRVLKKAMDNPTIDERARRSAARGYWRLLAGKLRREVRANGLSAAARWVRSWHMGARPPWGSVVEVVKKP